MKCREKVNSQREGSYICMLKFTIHSHAQLRVLSNFHILPVRVKKIVNDLLINLQMTQLISLLQYPLKPCSIRYFHKLHTDIDCM